MRGFFLPEKRRSLGAGRSRRKELTQMPQALVKEADIARSGEALMRKSLVGDALWRSDKLNQIGLPSYRAEYANLQFNRGCCCGCGQKQ